MYHQYPDWQDWQDGPDCIYLGSEIGPYGRYDYWLIRTGDGPLGWSPTARHGSGAADYGSRCLSTAWYDYTHCPSFGIDRAMQLSLYYLATGLRQLVRES